MYRIRNILIVLFAVVISSHLAPLDAVSATSISVDTIADTNGDCTQLTVDVAISGRIGDTLDGMLDFYYVVIYDGNGNPHASDSLGAPVPSSNDVLTTIDQTFYGAFAVRPMRVVMYDVTASGALPISTVEAAPIVVETTFDPVALVPSCGTLPTTVVPVAPMNLDERENALDLYPYQTVAVYCMAGGMVDIYRIDPVTANGDLALRITADVLAEVGVLPDTNQLIDETADGVIRLYRLTSGELQVMGRDGYIFIWDGCP